MGGDERSTTVVLVVDGDVEVVIGRVDATRPDLTLVDGLARLQLAAAGLGWRVRLRRPSPALSELLDLVGLAGLFAGPCASAFEVVGEAEEGEQLRVEEVVQARDPPA